MLSKATATLPAVDTKRAIGFYVEKLGLQVTYEDEYGQALIALPDGSEFTLYQRAATVADQTVLSFTTNDIEADVERMRGRGVVFEEYTMPESGLVTVNGIASLGPTKAAWFKDTEGNIVSVLQLG